jgi:hypothetical protein
MVEEGLGDGGREYGDDRLTRSTARVADVIRLLACCIG